MSSLAEIKTAAQTLSFKQREKLLLLVAASLRKERQHLPKPRMFSSRQIQSWIAEDERQMRKFLTGSKDSRK